MKDCECVFMDGRSVTNPGIIQEQGMYFLKFKTKDLVTSNLR